MGLSEDNIPNASGHIIMRKGQTIKFYKVFHEHNQIRFRYGPDNLKNTIPLASLRKAIFDDGSHTAVSVLKVEKRIFGKFSLAEIDLLNQVRAFIIPGCYT